MTPRRPCANVLPRTYARSAPRLTRHSEDFRTRSNSSLRDSRYARGSESPERDWQRPGRGDCSVSVNHTARRLRPFARRDASTLRPPRVAIRARNPCVRLRLMTLGWNVRFMAQRSGDFERERDSKNRSDASQFSMSYLFSELEREGSSCRCCLLRAVGAGDKASGVAPPADWTARTTLWIVAETSIRSAHFLHSCPQMGAP